ncbi:MAG: ABC transporter ATP-binding protein [Bacteroidota bacterium]
MKALWHINKYFYRYKWRFILGFFFVIISNLFAIYPAQFTRDIIDKVRDAMANNHDKSPEELLATLKDPLLYYFIAVVVFFLLKGIFLFLMRQTIIVMSRLIERDLKNEVFEQYEKLDLAFYKRNNTGDIMNRISEDVSRVRMYIGPAIMYSLNLAALFVLVIVTMLSVNVKLTLYALLPLPIMAISIYYVSNIINKQSELVQEQQSKLSTFVQEAFSGIRVLKSFVREEQSSADFDRENKFYRKKSIRLATINAIFFPLIIVLIGLSTLITIYVGGIQVIKGQITMGNIAEFIIYINMLTWPFAAVGWVTSLVNRAAASQVRINEFLHTESEIKSPADGMTEMVPKITFDKVSFVYPDSKVMALNNVSFQVEEGKSLAILGRTGSGKSTIANLLARMYDTTSGKVCIGKYDIRTLDLGALRSNIGMVPQDVFLFSDTIANKIAFGLKDLDRNNKDLIEKAAKDAAIYSNIMEFPEGFETKVGERGITLSGGQKQRISIARAIIKKPKILVFDDCLSAVDTQTEEEILNNLKDIMNNRTTVIISHRVSSVKNADHIIFLESGSIVEEGTHQQLIEKQGHYYSLYEKQLLEEEA